MTKNNVWTRMMAVLMTVVMVVTMLAANVAYAATNTSGNVKYTIDLEAMSDKEFDDAAVDIRFYINGKFAAAYDNGRTILTNGEMREEPELGHPVLLNLRDGDTVTPITFLPLRKIANIYGLHVDWNDETKSAILDTPKGRIVMPLNSSVVTTEDGSVSYQEETYTYKGERIPLILYRNGRVYTTVRFISSFIMPDAVYTWEGVSRLTIRGTVDGTTVGKTYGINENYMDSVGCINFLALPTVAEVMKGIRGEIEDYRVSVYTSDPALRITTPSRGWLHVTGYYGSHASTDEHAVLNAVLTDLVNADDAKAIMDLFYDISMHLKDGYSEHTGITEAAMIWRDNFPRTITLKEVVVTFDEYLHEIDIRTK